MRARGPAFLFGMVVVALAACSDASSDVTGGEQKFDTAPPKFTDTCDDGKGGAPTWSGVYTDYFSPTSRSGCAGDKACHGTQNEPGFGSSQFLCGADKGACRDSLLGGSGLVQVPKDQATPDKSGLLSVIRRDDGAGKPRGTMPKRPQCTFSKAAIDRIQAWIKNGAAND